MHRGEAGRVWVLLSLMRLNRTIIFFNSAMSTRHCLAFSKDIIGVISNISMSYDRRVQYRIPGRWSGGRQRQELQELEDSEMKSIMIAPPQSSLANGPLQ